MIRFILLLSESGSDSVAAEDFPHAHANTEEDRVQRVLSAARVASVNIHGRNGTHLDPNREALIARRIRSYYCGVSGFKNAMIPFRVRPASLGGRNAADDGLLPGRFHHIPGRSHRHRGR